MGVPTDQAVDSLETWIRVYDAAVENGEDYDVAVVMADEVVRVAGPYPSQGITLHGVLKEFYLPPATLPQLTTRR